MELKVWVDGIKRVVCGVTDNTTCQDIVIALAHAMGQTGRFTLMEKWRDNERPLPPSECPLKVLQKWGEFANEVQLTLLRSDTKEVKKEGDGYKNRVKDRFTHNFTPPLKQPDASVKRSLTFSGAHTSNIPNHHYSVIPSQGPSKKMFTVTHNQERLTQNGEYLHDSSSNPSQNLSLSGILPKTSSNSHNPILTHRTGVSSQLPSHNPILTQKTGVSSQLPSHNPILTQKTAVGSEFPSLRPSHVNSQNLTQLPSLSSNIPSSTSKMEPNGAVLSVVQKRTSAFQAVKQRMHNTNNYSESARPPAVDNDISVPVYSVTSLPGSGSGIEIHKPEVEEYDLDSNFPDVVKDSNRDVVIEEYKIPGRHVLKRRQEEEELLRTKEHQEKAKLCHLVACQQERIKLQSAQLEILENELKSKEAEELELEKVIQETQKEYSKLSHLQEQYEIEIKELDSGQWIDQLELEKQTEKVLKNELTSLKTRLEKCEHDLKQFQAKVKVCSEEMDKEKDVIEKDKKRRKDEEIKIQQQISELEKDLKIRSEEINKLTINQKMSEEDLASVEKIISQKKEEVNAFEKELREFNIKDLDISEIRKSQQESGEAIQPNYGVIAQQRGHWSSRSWRGGFHHT
ncbi:hypothetical protein CHS0354_016024 [Potamilus streckersoni]|uniref:Ras-associating domain-containing protein n=1 Tax=Potamilus streckersoni TaxID=2493646 RepID=A0AAE0RML7_9BIVA|nr:hypothetical protein CHS0354_016024 [Potamilus streckersoni]